MTQKDLKAQIASAGMEKGMKTTTKAKTLEAEAAAKGDFADTEASLAEDKKYLADLDSECKTKSFDYEQRQIVRAKESLPCTASQLSAESSPGCSCQLSPAAG